MTGHLNSEQVSTVYFHLGAASIIITQLPAAHDKRIIQVLVFYFLKNLQYDEESKEEKHLGEQTLKRSSIFIPFSRLISPCLGNESTHPIT